MSRYLAHTATLLGTRFTDPETQQACNALAARIDAAAPAVLATLPPLAHALPPPAPEHAAEIVAAILRYRGTSPQMVGLLHTLTRGVAPGVTTLYGHTLSLT